MNRIEEKETPKSPKKGGFHWGHGIIVALLSFIIFILTLVVYFTNTMKNSELITDNYYQDELEFQNVIDAKNRAETLPNKPNVNIQKEGLKISFPKEINNANAKFNFFLYRTDDKNLDIKKEFQVEGENTYIIPANILKTGSYTLRLMWKKEDKDYQIDYDILWK